VSFLSDKGRNIFCFKLFSFSSRALRKFSPRAKLNKFCNQKKLSGFTAELPWLHFAFPFCDAVKVSEGKTHKSIQNNGKKKCSAEQKNPLEKLQKTLLVLSRYYKKNLILF
jgi:hypothetical protein